MSASTPSVPQLGLRERKKLKTRLSIQEHALRLIRAQGYEATTVEQIADAAEISPSTFFRYFPTKEAVVLTDEYDPLLIEAFRAQPAGIGCVRALRLAYRSTFEDLSAAEAEIFYVRAKLCMEVPELRAAFLDQLVEGLDVIMAIITERTGRSPDDPEVRALSGSVMGVAVTEFLHWSRHPETDFIGALDRAMEQLESAFPI